MNEKYILNTYLKKICLDKGKGSYVYDTSEKKYLDFIGGIATCSIGHSNVKLKDAVLQQMDRIINPSNLFFSVPQLELAEKMSELSGLSKCFFSNSGTEANEAAIKLARKVTGKKKIVCMKNAFHGRTMGSLSATWEPKYKEPFKPLLDGFLFTDYDDVNAIDKIVANDNDIAAVMLEPIQGEAGVLIPREDFLQQVKGLCETYNCLLILDEVQTGNGRTGKYFCYQHTDILPDIVTTAKGIANGIPIGVTLAKQGVDFEPGDHGSTFGGNSLCCAAALATIAEIEKIMPEVPEKSNYFTKKLAAINKVECVRSKGLMVGVVTDRVKEIVAACVQEGLLVNCAHDTLRMLPPLTVSFDEIDEAIEILRKVIEDD